MRSSRQLAIVALFFFKLLPGLADNMITNIMSPIVGFQYQENVGAAALTNGGIISPIVSCQFAQDFTGVILTNGGFQSPILSFQYQENLNASILTNGGIISSIASYQYFEWPGNNVLELQSSPLVSYFYQSSTTPTSGVLHGRVTDLDGTPLPGAEVAVMVYLTTVAQSTTDANGYYQFPSLDAGVYDLLAWDSTHQTTIRALTFNANTAEQDFQLKPMPMPPLLLQVDRSTAINYTVGDIMGSEMRIFDGSSFVPITANNWPSAKLKTIVMTHGWVWAASDSSITNEPFDLWPSNMAVEMETQSVTPVNANILAWDWRYAAMSLDPGIPADRTSEQGSALGEALQYYLGATYSQPLHFLGHSLGTLVNASAINYIHGEQIGTENYSPTPWEGNLIHITLFDQAQIAEWAGAASFYQSALPYEFTWADNYKSIVGVGDFPNAVNVNLQKGTTTAIVSSLNPMQIAYDAHGYPMDWYALSVGFPLDEYDPLGFKRSYEYAPLLFPPSDVTQGSTYHQTPSIADELALEPVTAISSIGLLPDMVVQTTIDTIQYTTGVTSQIVNVAQNDASSLFGYMGIVAIQGGQGMVNIVDSAALRISLTTSSQPDAWVNSKKSGQLPLATNSLNSMPVVWLPLQFPINATALAFDFTENGDPAEDVLVCGIATNTLFSVEAKYISTNHICSSRLIDVSAWAGSSNELFFGFLGGTSSNATMTIQNIRFYSLQPPQLNITQTNNITLLSWPQSSGTYSIATTTNLALNAWELITNIPTAIGSNYVFTNFWIDQIRFFRLQERQ